MKKKISNDLIYLSLFLQYMLLHTLCFELYRINLSIMSIIIPFFHNRLFNIVFKLHYIISPVCDMKDVFEIIL